MGQHVAGPRCGELLGLHRCSRPRRSRHRGRTIHASRSRRRGRRTARCPTRWTEPSRTSKGYPEARSATSSIRPTVVVDLGVAENDRKASGLRGEDAIDVGVEIGAGVVVPVIFGHRRAEGRIGIVVPEPPGGDGRPAGT